MSKTDIQTAREIMFNVFPRIGELPIKGGWGRTKEDAVVIDKNDSIINQSQYFNGVEIEYIFMEYFNYLHLITYRPLNDSYSGIRYKVIKQKLIHDDKTKKIYDKITTEVSCFTDADWDELKEEWENNIDNPDFDIEVHDKKRDSKKRYLEIEFWFEISSFYAKN